MLKGAKLKFEDAIESHLFCQDNSCFPIKPNSVDLVILLFDSINYMTEPEKIVGVFKSGFRYSENKWTFYFLILQLQTILKKTCRKILKRVLRKLIHGFRRLSKYNPETHIHVTEFELLVGKEKVIESHVERPYHFPEIERNDFPCFTRL